MGEKTGIAWTDSTFNPWWGCTKVGPGCDYCYAETLDGGTHWGKDSVPRTMSATNWRNPRKWEADHLKFEAENGRRRRVFCASMCDWADKNAPDGQRDRLWRLIKDTPHLDWLLLTKRAPNIEKYLPADWGNGYPNVWLGVTVENVAHGLPRVDILRKIPAVCRFLSIEPLLESLGKIDLTGIDWTIVGGESGSDRALSLEWVEEIKVQAEAQGSAFFYKQKGGYGEIRHDCLLNGVEVKNYPIVRTV